MERIPGGTRQTDGLETESAGGYDPTSGRRWPSAHRAGAPLAARPRVRLRVPEDLHAAAAAYVRVRGATWARQGTARGGSASAHTQPRPPAPASSVRTSTAIGVRTGTGLPPHRHALGGGGRPRPPAPPLRALRCAKARGREACSARRRPSGGARAGGGGAPMGSPSRPGTAACLPALLCPPGWPPPPPPPSACAFSCCVSCCCCCFAQRCWQAPAPRPSFAAVTTRDKRWYYALSGTV